MKLPRFEFAEPESVADACRLLSASGVSAEPIAGGTDLLIALKNRQKKPGLLVDIGALPDLNRIAYSPQDGLRIGACVTLKRLALHPVVRKEYPLLVEAALSVGSVQLQAMGTVGGNLCQDSCCMFFNRSPLVRESLEACHKLGGTLCHVVQGSDECWATYTGDLAPALLALRAAIHVADTRGEHLHPLETLYSGDGKNPHLLRPGQLLKEIRIPAPRSNAGGVYLKLRQRDTLDYPQLGVAVHLALEPETGLCTEARLALTAVDKAPVLVAEAELLAGSRITEEHIVRVAQAAHKQAHPLKNQCGLSNRYRMSMVGVYVEQALRQAMETASKRGVS